MIPQASLMMPNATAEAPAIGKGSAAAGSGPLAGDKGNVRADVKGAELSKGLSFADLLQGSDSAEFTTASVTSHTTDDSDDAAASDKSGGEELPVDLLARLQASLQTNAELTAPKQELTEDVSASQDADNSSEPAPLESTHSDAKAGAAKQSAMAQASVGQAANTLLSPQANTAQPTSEQAAVTTRTQLQTPDTSASAGGIALESLLAAGMTKVDGQTLATPAKKTPVADGDNAALGKALLEKAVADGKVITDKSAASSEPAQPMAVAEAYRQSGAQDKVTLTSNTTLAEGAAAATVLNSDASSPESPAPVKSPAPVVAEQNKKSTSPAESQPQSQEPEPVVTKSPASTAQSNAAAQSAAQQPATLAQAQDQLLAQAATMQPIQASRVTEQVLTQVQQAPASVDVAAASVSVTKEVLGTSKSESARERVAPASTPAVTTDNQSSAANQSTPVQSQSQLQAQTQASATSDTQLRRDSGLTHLGSQRLDGENVPSELQQKVNVMLSDRLQQAELQLEPLGLGRMKIHVQVGQDQQVSVHFVVQHGQTREMVEQSMPRLREMLAGQGISLGQTQVQQQASQQGQQQGQAQTMADNHGQGRSQGQGGSRGGSSSGQESELTLPTSRLARESANGSGIDFYA